MKKSHNSFDKIEIWGAHCASIISTQWELTTNENDKWLHFSLLNIIKKGNLTWKKIKVKQKQFLARLDGRIDKPPGSYCTFVHNKTRHTFCIHSKCINVTFKLSANCHIILIFHITFPFLEELLWSTKRLFLGTN